VVLYTAVSEKSRSISGCFASAALILFDRQTVLWVRQGSGWSGSMQQNRRSPTAQLGVLSRTLRVRSRGESLLHVMAGSCLYKLVSDPQR
jgi:hypothetical protein